MTLPFLPLHAPYNKCTWGNALWKIDIVGHDMSILEKMDPRFYCDSCWTITAHYSSFVSVLHRLNLLIINLEGGKKEEKKKRGNSFSHEAANKKKKAFIWIREWNSFNVSWFHPKNETEAAESANEDGEASRSSYQTHRFDLKVKSRNPAIQFTFPHAILPSQWSMGARVRSRMNLAGVCWAELSSQLQRQVKCFIVMS